jgi:hypothetical protein
MRGRLPRLGSNLVAFLSAWVLGCGGGALATPVTQPSSAPAPDAFSCVRQQLKTVGFSQTAVDVDALWVKAHRFDETQRRPDTQFRRMVDRLLIEVAPGTGESVSTITAEASTFAESATQRGPTEVQERTSETATAAAQTILRNCSKTADTAVDSVPGA